MLVHTEVSEAADSVMGDGSTLGEELADILIRVGDLAECKGIDLSRAVAAKLEKNTAWPQHYGTPWEQKA